jgi:hypothetical protein
LVDQAAGAALKHSLLLLAGDTGQVKSWIRMKGTCRGGSQKGETAKKSQRGSCHSK